MKITYLVALTFLSGCAVTRVAEVDNTFQGYDSAPAPNAMKVYEQIKIETAEKEAAEKEAAEKEIAEKEAADKEIAEQKSSQRISSLDDSNHVSASGLVTSETQVIRGITSLDLNDKNDVIILQEALINHGLDPGPVDGKYGKKTRIALEAFRKNNDIAPTENVSNEDISYLFYIF